MTAKQPSDYSEASQRVALCQSLVRSGARVVRDGGDHSDKVNRCIAKSGECVGYYAVLIDYDEASDTFRVGWQQRIPAAWVDEVAMHDAISMITPLLISLATSPINHGSAAAG
jgi:hypothetical protein